MNRVRTALIALVLLSFNVSHALPTGIGIAQSDVGTIYTTANGMTLYINPSHSCIGACLKKWPQAKAPAGATAEPPFTIQNGVWHLTGQPLHTWVLDLSQGQTTGHNVGGVWFAAQPEQ